MRELGAPFAGLFGACSTMAEALGLAAALCSSGAAQNLLAMTSSHFCAAERQFRTPLSYGAVRTPTAQWTATAAGCCLVRPAGQGVGIAAATFGRVQDYQIKDINNMGAAMAPAAMDSLSALFRDTETTPKDYDLIVTGDLGKLGSDILRDLMREKGYDLGQNYKDCGALVYDVTQKCYQGGSGCGCSASVVNSLVLDRLISGEYRRVAYFATGALMSTQSCYQGETIPCISHGVVIER